MTRTRTWLIAILLLAVLLRAGVAVYLGDTVPAGKDEQSYSELAARLATGHGYSFERPWYPFAPADAPTAHWSFLYTAFVAGVYRIAGPHPLAARLAQALLAGLLLPWLTYRLARRMLASPSPEHRSGSGAQERGPGG
jgi:4-amino-4-deoxy-L-arabinose transferase-like glycosyltransferase